jgi:hypothetical protein
MGEIRISAAVLAAVETLQEVIPSFPHTDKGIEFTLRAIQRFVGDEFRQEQLEWLVDTAIEESAHWPQKPVVISLLRDIWTRRYPRADQLAEDAGLPSADQVRAAVTGSDNAYRPKYTKRTRDDMHGEHWNPIHPGFPCNDPNHPRYCPVTRRMYPDGCDPCLPRWMQKGYDPKKEKKHVYQKEREVDPVAPVRTQEESDRLVEDLRQQLRERDEIIRRLQPEIATDREPNV